MASPEAQPGDAQAVPEFVIVMDFDATQAQVWAALTQAEQLAQWWGPPGMELGVAQFDLRPGGLFHFRLRGPDGQELWARWVFREIEAPARLVFVLSFSDEQGGITRQPGTPDWPLEMLTTITLAPVGESVRVTLRSEPLNATAEERKTFREGFPSMQQGFGAAFQQLWSLLTG
jgi:uncharacterized protein YndB with AHSA1/START domain